jgi:hypothetical protein
MSTRKPAEVLKIRAELLQRIAQMSAWPMASSSLSTHPIMLADCGFLVNVPLAAQLLHVCGEDDLFPPQWTDWWQKGHQHPAVDKALSPWKQATHAWLETQANT